jgi:hypothetical protein
VAAVIHKDSYRKASPSYEKLQGWIKGHGLKVCGPAEELYLTDINKTNEEQRIEIRLPVCGIRLLPFSPSKLTISVKKGIGSCEIDISKFPNP